MKKDETFVHMAIRDALKRMGWTLIAGQYPGGSDDELYVFNIFDSLLARDQSPDHRRHSYGKLVPDLIAFKDKTLLAIEAKPEYSPSDREKLLSLLSEKRDDFFRGLEKFANEKGFSEILPLNELKVIPVLAFFADSSAPNDEFAYLKVIDLKNVESRNLNL